VGHIADGTLRRMIDEPLSIPARDRHHYDNCPRCRVRYAEIAGTDRRVDAHRVVCHGMRLRQAGEPERQRVGNSMQAAGGHPDIRCHRAVDPIAEPFATRAEVVPAGPAQQAFAAQLMERLRLQFSPFRALPLLLLAVTIASARRMPEFSFSDISG